jgi:hypothetical protein
MAQVGLEVPGALVPCVRETALLQYRAAVEALHLAFDGQEAGHARRERERVARLDDLLDQLGWPGEPVTGAVELSARGELVRDALHGSLIDAGERLAVACEGNWRGEASADSVRSAAREVIGLDHLLRGLEAG